MPRWASNNVIFPVNCWLVSSTLPCLDITPASSSNVSDSHRMSVKSLTLWLFNYWLKKEEKKLDTRVAEQPWWRWKPWREPLDSGHQEKADGDADKSDKEGGRAFISDFPVLIEHAHAQHLLPSRVGVCMRDWAAVNLHPCQVSNVTPCGSHASPLATAPSHEWTQ